MPKGRHLKPEFFTDKHVVSVSPLARLLYQGLWCYAADCGHLDDEPIELKMRILPGDNCDVDELLDALADTGRVQRKDGVLFLPKLRDHARVDKRYETICDACKEAREHKVSAQGQTPPSTPNTQGSRRDHDGGTPGPHRDHDADGDGDGDGEVMVKDAPRARATTLPKDFAPNDTNRRIAAEHRVNLDRLLLTFKDWATANGKKYIDWHAALNTWIRREKPDPNMPAPVKPALPHVSELEQPPDGLSPQEYAEWAHAQRQRKAGGR